MQPDASLLLARNIPPGGPARQAALAPRVAELNARLRHHAATDVLRAAMSEIPDLALVSSFGAESVALLHLTAMVRPEVPVLFIDTGMLFTETLVYQQEVAERLGLRNLHVHAALRISRDKDPDGTLHRSDPDACCALRKTAPLSQALAHYDGWITGRKRFQSGTRAALDVLRGRTARSDQGQPAGPLECAGRAATTWTKTACPGTRWWRAAILRSAAPPAPPPSPLARTPAPGAGGTMTKTECGIHFVNGRMVRQGEDR